MSKNFKFESQLNADLSCPPIAARQKLDIVRRISKLPGRIRRHGDERGAKIGHALDLCKVTPHN